MMCHAVPVQSLPPKQLQSPYKFAQAVSSYSPCVNQVQAPENAATLGTIHCSLYAHRFSVKEFQSSMLDMQTKTRLSIHLSNLSIHFHLTSLTLKGRNPIIASRTLDLTLLLGWLSAWNALKVDVTTLHPDQLLLHWLHLKFSRLAQWELFVDFVLPLCSSSCLASSGWPSSWP